MDRGAWWATVHRGHKESDTTEVTEHAFQARVLEWVAISFSRDLPDPGIEPVSPAL